MSETKIVLTLDQVESQVLVAMAQADCRPPRDQVRQLIQSEAKRRGLWPTPTTTKTPASAAVRP